MTRRRRTFPSRLRSALIGIAPLLCAAAAARWLPVSYLMEPGPRFLYWAALCGMNWLALLPLTGSIIQTSAGAPLRRLMLILLLGLVAGGAFLFQYLGLVAVQRWAGPLPTIAVIGEYALPIGVGVVAAQALLLAGPFSPPMPPRIAVPEELRMPLKPRPAPPGHNTPADAAGDPLSELLAESTPLAVRRRRLSIRLIWTDGETILRMRFEEALPLLSRLPGARVHRNWWVHREGVADIRRRGRRVRLVLHDGREVPVGGTYEPQLVAQGWEMPRR